MLTNVEKRFHEAMFQIYVDERAVRTHDASRFRQMVLTDGGLATAKRILAMDHLTQGFKELWQANRLDLTVEALVLRDPWRQLFTAQELAIAQRRLDDVSPAGWRN